MKRKISFLLPISLSFALISNTGMALSLDAAGTVVSYEENNKFSGLLYHKRWKGWQSEYD